MFCDKCQMCVEDVWSYCPKCGGEIGKAGGISLEQIQDFLKKRKETLDVLEQIINELETYGKIKTSTSLIASCTKIVSGILWLILPDGKSAAVVGDLAAAGLSMVDLGFSLLAAWKESGLLKRADDIGKKDHDIFLQVDFWFSKVVASAEIARTFSQTFNKKIKDEGKVYSDGNENPRDNADEPSKLATCASILANLQVFVKQCMQLYNGNCSAVAERITQEYERLKEYYDKLKSVSEGELAGIFKATQSV